jgi:hypothetical protein
LTRPRKSILPAFFGRQNFRKWPTYDDNRYRDAALNSAEMWYSVRNVTAMITVIGKGWAHEDRAGTPKNTKKT